MQEAKDQKIAKQLRLISSSGSSLVEVAAAQKELRSRVATRLKDTLKPQLEAILSLPAMTLLDHYGAEQLLDSVAECLGEEGRHAEATRLLELLLDVGSMSPLTLGTSGSQLASALTAAVRGSTAEGATPGPLSPERKPALVLLLRLVHATSQQLSAAVPSVRKQIVAVLCELCCKSKVTSPGPEP